jgi:hypothetical protein
VTKIFKRTFVRATIHPTDGKSFEIPADWLTWGSHVDLQIGSGTGGSGNKWTAWFQLVLLDGDLSSRILDSDKVRAHPTDSGSSNFTLDAKMTEPRMRIDGVPVPFILHRGNNAVLAAVEVRDYDAEDLDEAVALGRAYFNYLNATFVFLFHLPLKYRISHIARVDNADEYDVRAYMPWPEGMPLGTLGFEMPAGIASRLVLTYAEGAMSNSQAYRFLCFFKIVDHVYRVGGPQLRKLREQRFASATWLDLNDVIPQDPFERFDKEAVGETYSKTYDRYFQSDIRNSVAHVLATDEAFEPLDPEEAAHYRAAATLFRFMSHHLIRLVALNAKSLVASGASAADLEAAFYPKTKAKR